MKDPLLSKSKLNRNVLNIVRTTQRNNIDLKHIADNKANILMSVNALMITFLIPIVFANIEVIRNEHFFVPLGVLVITCIVTIMISATVQRPFSSSTKRKEGLENINKESPFFFDNHGDMSSEEFYKYFKKFLPMIMKYLNM